MRRREELGPLGDEGAKEAPTEKRPRLSVEELKHAALKPSTHRTY